jgi:hypothetical protein
LLTAVLKTKSEAMTASGDWAAEMAFLSAGASSIRAARMMGLPETPTWSATMGPTSTATLSWILPAGPCRSLCSRSAAGRLWVRPARTAEVGMPGGTTISMPSPRSAHTHTCQKGASAVAVIAARACLIASRSRSVRPLPAKPTTSV